MQTLAAHGAKLADIAHSDELREVIAHAISLELDGLLERLCSHGRSLRADFDSPLEHGAGSRSRQRQIRGPSDQCCIAGVTAIAAAL